MKRAQSSSEHASSSHKPTQKKTRFVAPEDDPASFAEDVDAQLENSKQATRKGRVNTEGYDSDSTDDGEGVVLSRRKDGKQGNDENEDEDDDMFAVGEKEEKTEARSAKKGESYLRLGDIEGQEFNDANASGSDAESEISEEDEPEDEDEVERRKKAGMGYELSSFNMREEMEEGKFTEDGTFVRTFDPHAIHDRWLDDTDEREIKRARRAKRAQERKERDKLKAEARQAAQSASKEEMETEMLGLMKRSETVLEALARLGQKVKKLKAKDKLSGKRVGKTLAADMDVDATSKPVKTPAKQYVQEKHIEQLTTLASNLMSLGDVDIYNKTYEHLLRSVRSMGNVESDWLPPKISYEYKWDVPEANSDGQTFGPYGEDEMNAWYEAKYFGEDGEKVKLRVTGGEWGDWQDVMD